MRLRMKKKSDWHKIFLFSHQFLKKQRFRFAELMTILSLGSIVASTTPYIWGKIIDEIASGYINRLLHWLGLYLLITLITLGLSFFEGYCGSKLNYNVEADIKRTLMKKALYLRCKDLDALDSGVLVSRVVSDAGEVINFVFEVMTSAVTIAVNIAVALFFSFKISVPLSIVSLAFIPLSIFSNIMFKKSYKVLNKQQKKYGDMLSSFHIGTLGHIPEIKAYCLEEKQAAEYGALIEKGWALQKKQLFLGNKTAVMSTLIGSASTVATLTLSAHLIARGTFTLGGMASFQRYIDKLTSSVSTLLQMNYSAQSAVVAVERMTELLSLEDEMTEEHGLGKTWKISQLEFRSVSFQYKDDHDVLNGISFRFDSPGIYALVGENGCGKTTVLKLIMQYYMIGGGQILMNDTPSEDIPVDVIRGNIGYYPKDVYIQDGTLLENLTMGVRYNPDRHNIRTLTEVCTCVGLSDFIQELPEGLETRVGENGKLLSSGQKQKIAIARAMLDDSAVLLFDEITSDLDGDAEKKIMSIIQEMAQTKIILLVTHRIQSVMFSTQTMVLENGTIVASGNHKELLQSSAKYRALFEKQNA